MCIRPSKSKARSTSVEFILSKRLSSFGSSASSNNEKLTPVDAPVVIDSLISLRKSLQRAKLRNRPHILKLSVLSSVLNSPGNVVFTKMLQ